MSNVSGVIKSIQDIMRKDVGVDGDAQRISQLVWLFFLKILDDREDELELTEDNYQSPLPEKLRWRNWAKESEGITGDELLNFVNNELFPTLKNELKVDGDGNKRALVIKNVFEDAYNYMKSGTLLRQVINKICEINFNASSDRHTFGSIYEQILKDLQSAGNAGEFYTPRAVTTFIVDRIAPQLEETVLDPACGTGGFLTNVIEYKRNNFVKSPAEEEILQKTIYGVEKKAMPHMKAVMLTTFGDEKSVIEAFKKSADGYVLKDVDETKIVNAIKSTMLDINVFGKNLSLFQHHETVQHNILDTAKLV